VAEIADEKTVLALLKRFLLDERVYVDTYGITPNKRRLCIDGTLFDVTDEEISAFTRWLQEATKGRADNGKSE
jgi:hypothetical protein